MELEKFVFFAGKGGVGKTTCSCAYAVKCFKQGMDVLLVSTDPAHSTDKVFKTEISYEPTEIREGLSVQQIDAEREAEKHMKGIEEEMRQIINPETISNLKDYLKTAHNSPGVNQASTLDAMINIMNNSKEEKVVFDTAPTGQTLRLLDLPDFLDSWSERLIKQRRKDLERLGKVNEEAESFEEDPLVKRLQERKNFLKFGRKTLRERSSVIPVLTPERLSVMETLDSVERIEENGISVPRVIINRITKGSPERARRNEYEEEIIREIEDRFVALGKIPMMDEEIIGMDKLEQISKKIDAI